jgi:hypothetical protein
MKMMELALELHKRHTQLMRARTAEAEDAAKVGNTSLHSIASTESERHRFLVSHLAMLIREGEVDEYEMDQLQADRLVLQSYIDANQGRAP